MIYCRDVEIKMPYGFNNIIVVGSVTGGGRTNMLLSMAKVFLFDGDTVLYISDENSKETILNKIGFPANSNIGRQEINKYSEFRCLEVEYDKSIVSCLDLEIASSCNALLFDVIRNKTDLADTINDVIHHKSFDENKQYIFTEQYSRKYHD